MSKGEPRKYHQFYARLSQAAKEFTITRQRELGMTNKQYLAHLLIKDGYSINIKDV